MIQTRPQDLFFVECRNAASMLGRFPGLRRRILSQVGRTGAAIALMRHAAAIRVRRLRTGVDADANHKGTQMIPRSCTLTKPGQVPPGAWRGRSTTLSVPKKSTRAWKGQLPAQGIGTCAATKTFPQMNRSLETTCKNKHGSRILREHFKSFKNLTYL